MQPGAGGLWCIGGTFSWWGGCYHPLQGVSALEESTPQVGEELSLGVFFLM